MELSISLRQLQDPVDDRVCRVRLRQTSGGFTHPSALCCVVNERQNFARQSLSRELSLLDHRCRATTSKSLGVLALVIVGGSWSGPSSPCS